MSVCRPAINVGAFLLCSLPYLLRQGLSLSLDLPVWLDGLFSVSALQCWVTDVHHRPQLYIGAGVLPSDPCVCTVSACVIHGTISLASTVYSFELIVFIGAFYQ